MSARDLDPAGREQAEADEATWRDWKPNELSFMGLIYESARAMQDAA